MPNWCYTQYVAEGPKDELQRLYDTMKKLQDMRSPGLIANDFGSSWLGNLVATINDGIIPHNFRCRGYYYNLELSEGLIRFDTETAWWDADDTRHLIEEKFPGVKLYYCAEEFGCCGWSSNDVSHVYFDEEYYFSADEYDGENYMSSLDELVQAVEDTCNVTGLKTYEDCKKAADQYEGYEGDGATVMKLKFEDN